MRQRIGLLDHQTAPEILRKACALSNSSFYQADPGRLPRGWVMTRKDRRARATGRRGERADTFVPFLHTMLTHQAFLNLSPAAHKTLNYLASQCKRYNNGDLDICEKNAKRRGLQMSAASLRRGAKELLEVGFVELTRQGGRNRNSLYALSWYEIPYDPNKHDYEYRGPTRRWLRQKSSSPMTQVESPVMQSAVSIHYPEKTASPMALSAPLSLPH